MHFSPVIMSAVVAVLVSLQQGETRAAPPDAGALIPAEALALLRPLPLVDANPGSTLPIRASGIAVRHNKTYYTEIGRAHV